VEENECDEEDTLLVSLWAETRRWLAVTASLHGAAANNALVHSCLNGIKLLYVKLWERVVFVR
jgi:hypothetical protein